MKEATGTRFSKQPAGTVSSRNLTGPQLEQWIKEVRIQKEGLSARGNARPEVVEQFEREEQTLKEQLEELVLRESTRNWSPQQASTKLRNTILETLTTNGPPKKVVVLSREVQ